MKRIIVVALLSCIAFSSINAQIPDVSKSIPKSFDVKSLTGSIMGVLGPKLSLNEKQSSGVSSAISSFLDKKANILPLATTDPTEYNSKFGSLFGGLKSNLAGILVGNQMKKFTDLKPKTNDPSNVLSNLFY